MYIFIVENGKNPSLIRGSIFQILASIFKKHQVQCVLVGGYAVAASNFQRMTFDIDFMLTLEDYRKIEPDILDAGYSVYSRQEAFVQLKGNKPGLRDLDFLLSNTHTLDEMCRRGKTTLIAGETFIIPSPLHLVAMKLHSMAGNPDREQKDILDVVQLMALNSIDPKKDDIKAMFVKYKAMHLFDKIVEALDTKNEKRG